jgi:hypothetical protein
MRMTKLKYYRIIILDPVLSTNVHLLSLPKSRVEETIQFKILKCDFSVKERGLNYLALKTLVVKFYLICLG